MKATEEARMIPTLPATAAAADRRLRRRPAPERAPGAEAVEALRSDPAGLEELLRARDAMRAAAERAAQASQARAMRR